MRVALLILALTSLQVFALDITNNLSYTGEGDPNPLYGERIKNLMIFHPTGARWWYELEATNPDWESTWPLD